MVLPVGLAIVEECCDSRGVQADGEWLGLSVDQQTLIGSRTGHANHIIWKTTIIGDIHLIERADIGHEPSPGMGSRIVKQFLRDTAGLFPRPPLAKQTTWVTTITAIARRAKRREKTAENAEGRR